MAVAGKLLRPTIGLSSSPSSSASASASASTFARRVSSGAAPFSSFSFGCPIRIRLQTRTSPAFAPPPLRALPEKGGAVQVEEDGISLGTMKLPPDTNVARLEDLLFQWANSLCQGANLPLPSPLKVDKIEGGVRLGFTEIGDGKIEVPVYIDCLVSPANDTSAPVFRAWRNGSLKDRAPPGEPRIMRSLLQALQKSVQIAKM